MKKCLIVDDSLMVRRAARRMLEEIGFSCEEAVDGQQALDACARAGMPEVILLDWNMPVMDGISFLRVLRATDAGMAPRIIFCTTENAPEKIEEALTAGADEYIMKPFDTGILRGKLQQIGAL